MLIFGAGTESTAVLAARAAGATRPAGAGDGLIHDSANGAGAPAALGAAAEATVDLAGGAWRLRGSERSADVVIA